MKRPSVASRLWVFLVAVTVARPGMSQDAPSALPAPELEAPVATDTNIVPEATSTNAVAVTNSASMSETVLRDPFWPVGYEPAPPVPEEPPEIKEQKAAMARVESMINWPVLRLKGVTRTGDGRYLGMIERVGIVESGQIVAVRHGELVYTWRIDEVSNRGVAFTRLEAKPFGSLEQPINE